MLPLEQAYLKQEEPNRSCLLAIREIILAEDEFLTESLKYGMPFFSYKGKMFCYFWFDKKTKHPYIGFSEGRFMQHPKLISDGRKRIKIYPIDPNADIPIEEFRELLQLAIQVY